MNNAYLIHHGILGQKWGIRRFQNEDGSLTPRGKKHLEKQDEKWAKTKGEKIKKQTHSAVKQDMINFVRNELNPQYKTNGKLTSKTILQYNNKLSELMNKKIGDVPTPSGRVLRFVAKRGELGVHTAYADAAYDLNKLKQGVYSTGKVGYKNENLMNKD